MKMIEEQTEGKGGVESQKTNQLSNEKKEKGYRQKGMKEMRRYIEIKEQRIFPSRSWYAVHNRQKYWQMNV